MRASTSSALGMRRASRRFIMRPHEWHPIALCKQVWRKHSDDAVSGSAAAVSYYFLSSFFPFLVFVTALIAYLPLKTPVEHFLDRVRPVLPAQVMVMLDTHLR